MIISSQNYLDYNKVDQKIDELNGQTKISLPVVLVGKIDGQEAYALIDGHHTGAAAKELGIEIEYVVKSRNEYGYDSRWTTEEALEALWIDSDWRNYETDKPIF